jgi:hypothetical protein
MTSQQLVEAEYLEVEEMMLLDELRAEPDDVWFG